MKITIFTGNQPRHVALVESLSSLADETFAVVETTTHRPGAVADLYRESSTMERYFARVGEAEFEVFGPPRFFPNRARVLPLRLEDLSASPISVLQPALESDFFVVFGASYIRGPLIDALIERRAVNIHMGVSPFYRGSACNFWAAFDGRLDLVGATIHVLTRGLDSGPMLFHALPDATAVDPFKLGMRAVLAAHRGLVSHVEAGSLLRLASQPQDRSQELRYSRTADFTDDVAEAYLNRLPSPSDVIERLSGRDLAQFWQPYVDQSA